MNGEFFGFNRVRSIENYVCPTMAIESAGRIRMNYGQGTGYAYPPAFDSFTMSPITDLVGYAFDNPQYFPDVCFVFPLSLDTIFAHKAILCARSKFFRTLFMKKPKANVKVEVITIDEDPVLFRKIIRYMYTGRMTIESKMNAIELIRLATKYHLIFLAKRAQAAISHEFNSKGFSITLALSSLSGTSDSILNIMTFMDYLYEQGYTENTFFNGNEMIPDFIARDYQVSAMKNRFNMMPVEEQYFYIDEPVYMFKKDILWLVDNPCFSDVSLSVSSDPENDIKCHRFMLSLASFYFKNVFQSMYILSKKTRKTEKEKEIALEEKKKRDKIEAEKRKQEEAERERKAKAVAAEHPLTPEQQQAEEEKQYTMEIAGMKFPREGNRIKIGTTLIDPNSVRSLMEIGFTPDIAVWALVSSNSNVEHAANYLFTRIVSDENKRELSRRIAATMESLKPKPKLTIKLPEQISSEKEKAREEEEKKARQSSPLSYCCSCMSLFYPAEFMQCANGCKVCDDCFLFMFRRCLSTLRPSDPLPALVPCPALFCPSGIILEKISGILDIRAGMMRNSFKAVHGQRALSKSERQMKRVPFKLMFPGEIVSARALSDYVRWLYSGFDINLSISKKKVGVSDVKVALNVGDLFKDQHYKNLFTAYAKFDDKFDVDTLYKLGLKFDCKWLIIQSLNRICDDFESVLLGKKHESWSKELCLGVLDILVARARHNVDIVPFVFLFAHRSKQKYPDEKQFNQACELLHDDVNKFIYYIFYLFYFIIFTIYFYIFIFC